MNDEKMSRNDLRALLEAYCRQRVPEQAILTSLGDIAEALVETGKVLGFDMPGIKVTIKHIKSGEPPVVLAAARGRGQ